MFSTTFRRILTASALVIGSSVLLTPSVNAQVTDNGVVTGTVSAINLIDYTQPAAATILDPTNGNTDMDFGSLAIQNNDNDGWTLEVASTNGSALIDAVTSSSIAYTGFTAERGNGDLTPDLSAAGVDVTLEDVSALTCGDATGCTYNLDADIASGVIDGKPAGDYTDTLTFTLTAK